MMIVEQVLYFDWKKNNVFFKNREIEIKENIQNLKRIVEYFDKEKIIFVHSLGDFVEFTGLNKRKNYREIICETENQKSINKVFFNGFTYFDAKILCKRSTSIAELGATFNLEGNSEIEILFNYLNFILKDFKLKRVDSILTLPRILNEQFWDNFDKGFYKEKKATGIFFNKVVKGKLLPSFELYQLFELYSKAGFMDVPPSALRLQNVQSYDLKSAYLGAFLLADFPIGAFKEKQKPQMKDLKSKLFCWIAEIETDIEYPELQNVNKKIENHYAITNYDYEWLEKCYPDFIFTIKKINKFYRAEKGKLDPYFLLQILELYKIKEENKKNNVGLSQFTKSILHEIYGKMVQKIYYKDKEDYEKQIRNRTAGKYNLPQFAIWANSFVKKEVVLASEEMGLDFVAADTDCCKNINNHSDYFEKRNIEIYNELDKVLKTIEQKTGIKPEKTNIGTWEKEGVFEEYITFDRKKYCYLNNGEITCKFNGCMRDSWKAFVKENYKDNPIKFFDDCCELGFSIPNKYQPCDLVLIKKGEFEILNNDYVILPTPKQKRIKLKQELFIAKNTR